MIQPGLVRPSPQPSPLLGPVLVSPFHPLPERISVQLVCFPPAAGGFISFRHWLHPAAPSLHHSFPADWAIFGVQFPWTGWTYDTLVAALTEALEDQRAAAPLVLCGVSLGALLAFGVARSLRQRGLAAPLGLAAVAMSAPQLYTNPRGPATAAWTLDEWRAELIQLGGTSREALDDPMRLAQIVQRVQGSLSIASSYTYSDEPPFPFPMATFGGGDDKEYPPETLLAWSQQTIHSFHSSLYPQAGHLDVLETSAVRCCFLADLVTTIKAWQETSR